jgi:hypothetical protein
MVAKTFCEPLLLYIAATPRTASAVLVAERVAKVITKEEIDPPCPGAPPKGKAAIPSAPLEELPAATSLTEPLLQSDALDLCEEKTPEDTTKVQKPVYFISTVLHDARECYTMQQKLLYSLLIASRKLRHYFRATRSRWSLIGPWRQSCATQTSPEGWQNGPWSFSPSRSPLKPPM